MQLTLGTLTLAPLVYTLMTTSVRNNSVFRSFFEKQKLTGPNFIDWYRQLRLVLLTEDKENYIEHHISVAPVAQPGQQVPPTALAAHAAWVKGQKEVAELKAMFSKQAEQELLQTVREFHTCRQEEGQSVSSHVLKMKGYIDNLERLGQPVGQNLTVSLILVSSLRIAALCGILIMLAWRKTAPEKETVLVVSDRVMKRWSYLRELALQGLRGSKKLKPGALSLYVGDGHHAAVEAIRTYHLELPSFSFARYGYVYLLKHKHEVFETFKVFQKEVENQLGKTIKSLRSDRGVFWDFLETAARILNMVPTKKVDKTPYEIWHGQAPKLSYLKVWGCEALVKRDTLTKPDKLDPRSFRCIFIGYPKETMRYSFYNPSENKVFVARNAEFFKNDLIDLKASESVEDLELIQEEDTNPSVDTSLNHEEDDHEINEPQSDINPIRDLGEPANYKAALLDPESKKWLDAMNVEMQSMKDNDVWVLVELLPNARTVGSKWLFKKKTDMDGAIYIFKARLVAKGFTQTYGVDYEETFSPVADIRAIRILIAIAAYYDYEIWQMDVKTAFLNGHLSEEVYMEQPEGFVNPKYPNHVCKLKRSIYGLKQASRQWNKRFDDEIKKFGFTQNPDEPCVYLKASGSYVAILILYVDDILLMGNNIPMLQDVKSYLGRSFAMKDLGDAAYIIGIKIYRDRKSLNCVKSQGASTPAEKQRMQNIPYASAIGSIMYAVRCTRPDVAFAQNMTSRFQQNPGEEHWTVVKNIIKYLCNTKDMFLVYGGNMERQLRVSCYTDAGYLTDADNLKSQTGYVFVLNGGAVDWKSTKQSIFATSSTDAEYIAAFDASKEVVWIQPISMYCDNTGAIAIAKDDGVTKGARHFRAKVHYLRETIKMGDVKIEKIDTDDNLADPFTKALAFPKHSELTRNIGLLPASSFM
ncbi:retrotransposon protein, putative, ty1-copia subclass [Tanacetum coccineum]